jgi:hypothetical protein
MKEKLEALAQNVIDLYPEAEQLDDGLLVYWLLRAAAAKLKMSLSLVKRYEKNQAVADD